MNLADLYEDIDEGKKLSAAFQTVILDDKSTNCGTTKTIKMILDKDYSKLLMYRYIKNGSGGFVLLTPDNIDRYIGKVIEMRSPMYCRSQKICNKCAGELYYMIGIQNIGLLSNRVGTSILNNSLKSFHNMTLSLVDIDISKYIE